MANKHLSADALRHVVWPTQLISGGVPHAPFSHIQPYMGFSPLQNHEGLKVVSWNVNGLKRLLRTNVNLLSQLLLRERPQMLCLQKTKVSAKLDDLDDLLSDYRSHYSCSTSRKNYGGTATFVHKDLPVDEVVFGIPGVPQLSQEGRVVTVVTPEAIVVNVFSPYSGKNLSRLELRTEVWEPALRKYLKQLRKIGGSRQLVVAGSLNVAAEDIDVENPEKWDSLAGFQPSEREALKALFAEVGVFDTFRKFTPSQANWFSHWPPKDASRERNAGTRFDYILASNEWRGRMVNSSVLHAYHGSDHCPVSASLLYTRKL